MIRIGPVTRILLFPTLAKLGLLLALVVAVFLAESFTTLLEEALRYGGGSADVLVLLAYRAPEIVDLALALGVLIALYFSLLDARDRGELVVLATSGVRWTRVVGFTLWLGLLGGLLSVTVSGFIVPAARYAERLAMAELRADHVLQQIVSPGPRNARQSISRMTFVATPPTEEGQKRGQLFGFQYNPDGSWRVGQSRDWDVTGPDADGGYKIRLNSTAAYVFPGFDMHEEEPPSISTIRARNTGVDFRMEQLLPVAKKAYRDNEKPLQLQGENNARLAGVISRAMLVPMAALLAIVSVLASGKSAMRFLSLPAAAVFLLLFDVLGRALLQDFWGAVAFGPLALGVAFVYLALPLSLVLIRGEAVMLPVRGKT